MLLRLPLLLLLLAAATISGCCRLAAVAACCCMCRAAAAAVLARQVLVDAATSACCTHVLHAPLLPPSPRQSERPSWTLAAPWAAGCQRRFSAATAVEAIQAKLDAPSRSHCCGVRASGACGLHCCLLQMLPVALQAVGTPPAAAPCCRSSSACLPAALLLTGSSSNGLISTRSCSGSICM